MNIFFLGHVKLDPVSSHDSDQSPVFFCFFRFILLAYYHFLSFSSWRDQTLRSWSIGTNGTCVKNVTSSISRWLLFIWRSIVSHWYFLRFLYIKLDDYKILILFIFFPSWSWSLSSDVSNSSAQIDDCSFAMNSSFIFRFQSF